MILTEKSLIISWLFLPFRQNYALNEVYGITQTQKRIKGLYGAAFKVRYIYTDHETVLRLANDVKVRLNHVGQLDYQQLQDYFHKLKRNEGKIKPHKKLWLLYFLENLDGIYWILVLLTLTTGLGYGLYTQFFAENP